MPVVVVCVVVVVVVCGGGGGDGASGGGVVVWQWCKSVRSHTGVHVPVPTLGSPPSTSLPGGLPCDVTLEVSGVGDGEVGLACDIIAAMCPSDDKG